jgi:hypothetical protein
MIIRVQFMNYNPRRYSKPWIARVTGWPVGGRPVLEWGGYLGNHHGGEVEIEVEAGDIVRWGQKDGRSGTGTRANWGIAQPDGMIEPCTEAQAAKAFRQKACL